MLVEPEPRSPEIPKDAAAEATTSLPRIGALRLHPSDLAIGTFLAIAIAVWWISLQHLPLHDMTDVGLPSVLPPATWVALTLVFVVFLVALRLGRTGPILMSVLASVVVLHGLGIVSEPSMRFTVAWRHVGIAEYFLTHGAVDPTLDAYQSWPGFFVLIAFLWKVTGIGDPVSFVAWAPIVYNVLYIGPIIAIGDKLLGNRTTVWVAVWLFTASNWIGQDYFSPQGWYLLSYLVVLAIVLRWFKDSPACGLPAHARSARVLGRVTRWMNQARLHGTVNSDELATRGQRVFLVLAIVVIVAATVAAHQLTPFAIILGIGALSVIGWCRLRLLPIAILLGVILWLAYFATGYLSGHGEGLLSQVGAVGSIFGQTVTERLTGTPGHTFIVRLRLLQTAATWLLAAVGILRLLRTGRPQSAVGLAVAAAATVPLLGLQSYGGEALLRVAFFALPFVSLLCAVAVVGIASQLNRKRLVMLAAVGVVLTLVFPFTRYGNERMDWYSSAEVETVRQMYSVAPKGSVLASITGGLPWRYTGYADYDYRLLANEDPYVSNLDGGPEGTVDLDQLSLVGLAEQTGERLAHQPGQRSFLIVSRSQQGELEVMGTSKPGAYQRLLQALDQSEEFRTVISNPDARLYEYLGPAPE